MLSFQWLISKHVFNVTLIEIMKYGVSIFLQVQSNKIQKFVKTEYYSAIKKISILIWIGLSSKVNCGFETL